MSYHFCPLYQLSGCSAERTHRGPSPQLSHSRFCLLTLPAPEASAANCRRTPISPCSPSLWARTAHFSLHKLHSRMFHCQILPSSSPVKSHDLPLLSRSPENQKLGTLSAGPGHANPPCKLTPAHAQLPLTYGRDFQICPSTLPFLCTFSQTLLCCAACGRCEWQGHECCSLLCVRGAPGARLRSCRAVLCRTGNYASLSLRFCVAVIRCRVKLVQSISY